MQSAECSLWTSRVTSRYIDWWQCIGTLKVLFVGGHGSMVYTYDAGFHGGHQGGLPGAQIGGFVLAPCQPLAGCWGWWVGMVYTGDAGFHSGLLSVSISACHLVVA